MEIVNLLDKQIVIFQGIRVGDAKLNNEYVVYFYEIKFNKHTV